MSAPREHETEVRVSVVFYTPNDEGTPTPHAIEVKYKGKDALINALSKTRKLVLEEHGVKL